MIPIPPAPALRRPSCEWREVPAPRRGELVRLLGEWLREFKPLLARMITLESGKIIAESLGEVQEMIDICDFAVGLSRQLYGLTIASERPSHRMMEQWHPLGPVVVISAFNFPVAVWAWNAALALVCGDPVIWKPSEKTPLVAECVMVGVRRAIARFGAAPEGLVQLVQGGRDTGEALVDDQRIALVSATGSTAMGRAVGPRVARRFGRVLLELGGNNAMIVCPSADLELAVRAILFSAAGTAGQRCTTLRRLIVHESIADALVARLRQLFESVTIGDPREADTLIGPLIDEAALDAMKAVLGESIEHVDTVAGGYLRQARDHRGSELRRERSSRRPSRQSYMSFATASSNEALALNNNVPQGLSSSIFTNDMREAERFMAAARLRLRDRQRQYRSIGCRDRRRVRRREGNRRRARERFGRVARLHAAPDQHDQLRQRATARPGHSLRHRPIEPEVLGSSTLAIRAGMLASTVRAPAARAAARSGIPERDRTRALPRSKAAPPFRRLPR